MAGTGLASGWFVPVPISVVPQGGLQGHALQLEALQIGRLVVPHEGLQQDNNMLLRFYVLCWRKADCSL